MGEMTSSTLLLVGGRGGVPVSSLSRCQFISTSSLLRVKAHLERPRGKFPRGRVENHFLLFRQERQTKVDNGLREGASSRE